MKKFTIQNSEYISAGHGDLQNPAVMKKIIFTANDLKIEGTIQMINRAKMAPGKIFASHFHEYMDEIFIIISGNAEINIETETEKLEATDTVFIPQMQKHKMKNIGTEDLIYIAIGVGKPLSSRQTPNKNVKIFSTNLMAVALAYFRSASCLLRRSCEDFEVWWKVIPRMI